MSIWKEPEESDSGCAVLDGNAWPKLRALKAWDESRFGSVADSIPKFDTVDAGLELCGIVEVGVGRADSDRATSCEDGETCVSRFGNDSGVDCDTMATGIASGRVEVSAVCRLDVTGKAGNGNPTGKTDGNWGNSGVLDATVEAIDVRAV